MRDILGQGGEREHGPWPRRLAAIAVLLLAAVLAAVYLPSHLRAPARSPQAPATTPLPTASPGYVEQVPGPGAGGAAGISGPAVLRWAGGAALPVSGQQPAWLWPATGRVRPISGLPRAGTGYQFTRVAGGWAVQAEIAGNTACSYCGTQPVPVYFLGDGARSVTDVGTANLVAPGAGPGQLWLTSYLPGAEIPEGPATAQELSATGVPLGSRVRLPAGEVIQQGTDGGLLLVPAIPKPGTTASTLWNPASPSGRGSTFTGVVAASATAIAWAPPCAAAGTAVCSIQVLDLMTGKRTTVTLPSGSSAASGAFSPDGQFLAVETSYYDSGSLAAQLSVATVASGQLNAVPGTSVSSDALVGFGWPTGGDSLIAELSFTTVIQVASWRPGAAGLAVAAIRPGQDSSYLVLG